MYGDVRPTFVYLQVSPSNMLVSFNCYCTCGILELALTNIHIPFHILTPAQVCIFAE